MRLKEDETMKKLLSLFVAIIVIIMLAMPCAAAGDPMTITDVNTQPGQTVYLQIALREDLVGDSIGISYSFDSALLKDIYKSFTWDLDGAMQDFNYKQNGVWANAEAKNLKGDICTLVFKVRDDAKFTETKVTCHVTVKNGSEQVGDYTVESTISLTCEHQYGDPVTAGSLGHSTTCKLCGHTLTQSHEWNEGERVEDEEDKNLILLVSTCSVCGEQKKEPVDYKQESSAPTDVTTPNHHETKPTEPAHTESPETYPMLPTMPKDDGTGETKPPKKDSAETEGPTKVEWNDPDKRPAEDKPTQQENNQSDKNDKDQNQNNQANKHDKDQNQNNQTDKNDKNQNNPSDKNDKNQNNQSDKNDKNQSQSHQNDKNNQNNSNHTDKGQNDKNDKDSAETKPTASYVDYNEMAPESDAEDPHAGHDHSNGEPTIPYVVEGNGIIETEPVDEHAGHDHGDITEEPQKPGVGIIVLVVVLVGLMIGLPVYIVKSKKKI